MNQKELRELIEFLIEKDIAEFELERGDVKLRVKRKGDVQLVPAEVRVSPVAASAILETQAAPPSLAAGPPSAKPKSEPEGLHLIRSPIVGTFYESASPGAPAFVKPGDTVAVGQVLCIIEAMKLMNEIEADIAGEVVELYAQNGQPVEYGQPLFGLKAA